MQKIKTIEFWQVNQRLLTHLQAVSQIVDFCFFMSQIRQMFDKLFEV